MPIYGLLKQLLKFSVISALFLVALVSCNLDDSNNLDETTSRDKSSTDESATDESQINSENKLPKTNTIGNQADKEKSQLDPALLSGKSLLDDLKVIAQEQLLSFLKKIPVGQEHKYGLANRADFTKVKIGSPYRMLTIHPDNLRGDKIFQKNIIALNQYRFPLLVDGNQFALLTVEQMDDEWKVVDFGARVLANELAEMEKQFSGVKKSGQEKAILRLYQLKSDFLLLDEYSKDLVQTRLMPLKSACINLGIDPVKSKPQTLFKLQAKLKQAMLSADKMKQTP